VYPGPRRGPTDCFTTEEDAIIEKALGDGVRRWAAIAELLPGRSVSSIGHRAKHKLGLTKGQGVWKPVEDETIQRLRRRRGAGASWDEVVEMLPGRTPAAVRMRAGALGLHSGKSRGAAWSPEEDAVIRRAASWKAIADALQTSGASGQARGREAVRVRGNLLGVRMRPALGADVLLGVRMPVSDLVRSCEERPDHAS
jgi:hypothetical protein